MYNNLVCAHDPEDIFVNKYTDTGEGNIFDFNYYCGPGKWMWEQQNANPITRLAGWLTAAQEAGARYRRSPLFDVSEMGIRTDFGIGAGSVVKNQGMMLPETIVGRIDFNGNSRSERNKISIGAIQ